MTTYTGELGKAAHNKKIKHNRNDRWVFGLLLAFMAISVAATAIGQKTGIGVVKVETTKPAAVRDIVLTHADGDRVLVLDAADRSVIAEFGPGEGGFVRGALRALDRMRLVADVPATAPYRLIRWEKGTVSLSDTVTGERLYLDVFGPDNAAAFDAFLTGYGE